MPTKVPDGWEAVFIEDGGEVEYYLWEFVHDVVPGTLVAALLEKVPFDNNEGLRWIFRAYDESREGSRRFSVLDTDAQIERALSDWSRNCLRWGGADYVEERTQETPEEPEFPNDWRQMHPCAP